MHAWDLQTALGQTRDVDPELCRRVLEEARATLVPEFRGDGLPFGAEVAVAADAPIADQMAAFMGRAIPA